MYSTKHHHHHDSGRDKKEKKEEKVATRAVISVATVAEHEKFLRTVKFLLVAALQVKGLIILKMGLFPVAGYNEVAKAMFISSPDYRPGSLQYPVMLSPPSFNSLPFAFALDGGGN